MTSTEDLAHWDQVAQVYAQTVGGEGDSFYRRLAPFLWQQMGDLAGREVLDLGCGHGWLAEMLHRAGARVTGIDGSAALIDIARARHPEISFEVHDLTTGLPSTWGPSPMGSSPGASSPELPSPGAASPGASSPAVSSPTRGFDRIVSHMVLMDLPTLDPLLADVAGALRPDGVLVLSILHPAFFDQAPVQDPATGAWHRHVRGYLQHEQRWIESFGGHTHYHRPLSWYVEQLARHGLTVTGLHEPSTLPAHQRPVEEWTDHERWFSTIPTMLALACRPLHTGSGRPSSAAAPGATPGAALS